MKRRVLFILLTFIVLFSCEDQIENTREYILSENETSITYKDPFGLVSVISKNPKRVVIAFNSLLGLWYLTGGESLTKARGSVNVPKEAEELVDLGSSRSLSIEAILALDPDLVIIPSNVQNQVKMAPILKSMGIEVMIVDTSINSYERFKDNAKLFSKINRRDDLYRYRVEPIINRIDNIISKTDTINNNPRVATLFATGRGLSIESDIALTGEMVKLLGGENIYRESDLLVKGKTRISFSIESIISNNPDIILISTMGSVKNCKVVIDKMIKENPVWNEVEAVKNGRVYYLPKEYSVYKPNQLYDRAFLHLANLLYPEEFKES